MIISVLLALSLYGFGGCDSPSSRSSLADKTKINAQQSEITVLTNKLSEQETLNKSMKAEIKEVKAKNFKLLNDSSIHSNNPWPWMITIIANNVLWLAFLYFSNSWKGRRGI